jgi:Tol biopolymer transport system component
MSGGSDGAVGFARVGIASAFALVLVVLVAIAPTVAHAAVGDVALVSRGATGAPPADGDSGPGVALSASGRYVAFESKATNLSDAAQPGVTNIYLRDTKTGTITLVSRTDGSSGAGADGDSAAPAISPAGRYVAFESVADNLSPDDDNAVRNIFVRDTLANVTTLVSRGSDGTPANGDSSHPSISANGSFVVFASTAANISPDNNDSFSNVYLRNMDTGEVTLLSRVVLGSLSVPADGNSYDPTIDRDGRRAAFTSDADNLSAKDNNAFTNVFVTDVQTRFTFAVSLPTGGFLSQGPSDGNSFDGVISADGRYVAFVSYAANFVDEPIRTPTIVDVFRRDIQASQTELVSRATGANGEPAFADSSHPSISGDGRFIAFQSSAGNLSSEDTADADIFIRSMDESTTTLISRKSGATGEPANGSSEAPVLSRDGRVAAFSSDAANLSDEDNDDAPVRDVFVRRVPVTPPPPETGPDLGTNDHSGHDPNAHADHTAAEHAGHTAAEHAGHVTASGAPAQTLFGPPVQDVDRLFILSQVHGEANVVVTATISLPGKGKVSRTYRCKGFAGKGVPAHKLNRVRLRLSRTGLKAVKRALKRGKRVRVKVVSKAQAATGGPWGYARATIRAIDTR